MKSFAYTLDPAGIPTRKNWDVTRPGYDGGPCVRYACPDECWDAHFKEWCRRYRQGEKAVPQPEPYEHCMFDEPISYGMVPFGCTDEKMIRAAWDRSVRSLLHGWDRDMTTEQLDAVVKATVDARMAGIDVGATPFMACIAVSAGL